MGLSRYERILIGISVSGVSSITYVLEGLVLFSYYHEKRVSAEGLSLASFVVGLLGLFVALFVGRRVEQLKQKTSSLMVVFAVCYSAALFMRYGGFCPTGTVAAVYYVLCYSVEIIGRTGLSVLHDVIIIEIFDDLERGKLYPIITAAGICGIALGLGLAQSPLRIVGSLISLLILLSNFWMVRYYKMPEKTRSVLPLVTTISSVFENSQYCLCLSALVGFWFQKSLPSLFLFFLNDVLEVSEDSLTVAFVLGILSYVLGGISSVPVSSYCNRWTPKQTTYQIALLGGVVVYALVFVVSYFHWIYFIVVVAFVGFINSLGSTIFKILCADCVDYDEYLTGTRRASAYVGVTNPLNTFISIAGMSIPLAVMSLLGFVPPDQDDRNDDSRNEPNASIFVLRLWCSVILGSLSLCSYTILRHYKIDKIVHEKIVNQIRGRPSLATEVVNPLDEGHDLSLTRRLIPLEEISASLLLIDPVADWSSLALRISTVRGAVLPPLFASIVEVNVTDQSSEKLSELVTVTIEPESEPKSVVHETLSDPTGVDPVTMKPPIPPFYLRVQQLIDSYSVSVLTQEGQVFVRTIGSYFPAYLGLFTCRDGAFSLFIVCMGIICQEFVLVLVWICLSLQMIICQHHAEAYLSIVIVTYFIFRFVWSLLHVKGLKLLKELCLAHPDQRCLERECLMKVGVHMLELESEPPYGQHMESRFRSRFIIQSLIVSLVEIVLPLFLYGLFHFSSRQSFCWKVL